MLKDCLRCGESKDFSRFYKEGRICKDCVQNRRNLTETFCTGKNSRYAIALIKNLVMAHRKKSKLEFECSFKDMQKFIKPLL